MALSKIDPAGLDIGQIGGRRNLIINGAMQVAQRGNTSNDNGVFVADRFQFRTNGLGGAGAVIAASTQSTVVPSGFASALKTNVTTAGSGFSADNRDGFATKLEHQDVTHLIDAGNSLTLSFWVRSSLATTYGLTITLLDRDTTSTADQYATSYTISTADTWEKKTITIPAPTSSRSGGSNNALGMNIYWNLEMISGGSRSSATANAWADQATTDQVTAAAADTGWMSDTEDFYITGVQLEVGDTATPFEHRSYGEELALCQRYYQDLGPTSANYGAVGQARSTTNADIILRLHGPMRADPTGSYNDIDAIRCSNAAVNSVPNVTAAVFYTASSATTGYVRMYITATGLSAGNAVMLLPYNGASMAKLMFDAEL